MPKDAARLLELPGVGRKTASCVMVYSFGIPDIPVDVHVAVVSRRIGLTRETAPDRIRTDLMKKIPKKYWLIVNRLFVRYGKTICRTRKPSCGACCVKDYCDYFRKGCHQRKPTDI